MNPSAINPLTLEMPDMVVDPSISSDDSIATPGPILTSSEAEDPLNSLPTNGGGDVTLLTNYDSSDDCESEDGASILDQ